MPASLPQGPPSLPPSEWTPRCCRSGKRGLCPQTMAPLLLTSGHLCTFLDLSETQVSLPCLQRHEFGRQSPRDPWHHAWPGSDSEFLLLGCHHERLWILTTKELPSSPHCARHFPTTSFTSLKCRDCPKPTDRVSHLIQGVPGGGSREQE